MYTNSAVVKYDIVDVQMGTNDSAAQMSNGVAMEIYLMDDMAFEFVLFGEE